jgi:hypothetical protein
MTKSIVGLDKAESDLILGYLYDVYERNVDIQVRFKWTPRTSALWYVLPFFWNLNLNWAREANLAVQG